MRANEFINEDRSQAIDSVMGHKVLAAYEKKKSNDPTLNFTTSLEVLKYINSIIPDVYMKWVAKQYVRDQYFFLHDLEQWQQLLNQFAELSKDKRFEFNKNIDSYQDINQLRSTLSNLGNKREEVGSKFYDKVINGANKFVESKQASWLYRSNEYSIYHPETWESSNIFSKLCDNVSACTMMNKLNFTQYKTGGELFYTISQDNVYVAYVPTKGKYDEFADKSNNHLYDIIFQTKQFPKLLEVIKNLYKNIPIPDNDKIKYILGNTGDVDSYLKKYFIMGKANGLRRYEKLSKQITSLEMIEFYKRSISEEQFKPYLSEYKKLIHEIEFNIDPEYGYSSDYDANEPFSVIYECWDAITSTGCKELINWCKEWANEIEYFDFLSLTEMQEIIYSMDLYSPERKKQIEKHFFIPRINRDANLVSKEFEKYQNANDNESKIFSLERIRKNELQYLDVPQFTESISISGYSIEELFRLVKEKLKELQQ